MKYLMPLLRLLVSFSVGLYFILMGSVNVCLAQTNPADLNNQNCLTCHTGVQVTFAKSVHNNITCVNCHGNISTDHLQGSGGGMGNPQASMTTPQNVPGTCGACHKEALTSYNESFHGRALSLGSLDTATCTSCHSAHNVVKASDSQSMVTAVNLPQTCGKCHVTPQANYAAGTEHKMLAAKGAGAPQYYTFKFFVWLTILSVIGLILHMELELLHMLRLSRRKD